MKIFDYSLKENPFPENKYMKEIQKTKFCFLDIETTGFSRKKDQIVLIGLLYARDRKFKLRQYFLEDPRQEKELLKSFINDLSEFDLMITYNGLSFDYPFIQSRAKKHQLPLKLNEFKHVDLYKHIQKNKNILPIENYRLKTIEKLLGIHRKDEISGGESVDLYHEYTQNKDERIRYRILLHNYEDIFYLPSITGIFSYFPKNPFLINSLYHSVSPNKGKNSKSRELTFILNFHDIKIKDHTLSVTGNTNALGSFQKISIFNENFTFFWSPEKEQYQLELFMQSELLDNDTRVFYINYQNFFASFVKYASADEQKSHSVYDNIIMFINSSINHKEASKILPIIIENILRDYLLSS